MYGQRCMVVTAIATMQSSRSTPMTVHYHFSGLCPSIHGPGEAPTLSTDAKWQLQFSLQCVTTNRRVLIYPGVHYSGTGTTCIRTNRMGRYGYGEPIPDFTLIVARHRFLPPMVMQIARRNSDAYCAVDAITPRQVYSVGSLAGTSGQPADCIRLPSVWVGNAPVQVMTHAKQHRSLRQQWPHKAATGSGLMWSALARTGGSLRLAICVRYSVSSSTSSWNPAR